MLKQLFNVFLIFFTANHFSYAQQIIVAANDARQIEKNSALFICDGENDQVEINNALKNYNNVLLSTGTFKISRTIVGKGSHLSGSGMYDTKIVASGNINKLIDLGGSANLIMRLDSLNKSLTRIRLKPAYFSGIEANDFYLLSSMDVFNGLRSYYWNGEIIQVKEIIPFKELVLTNPIRYNYQKEVKLYKYSFESPEISNLSIINNLTPRSILCELHETNYAKVTNVFVDGKGTAKQGIRISNSSNIEISNSKVINVMDSATHQGQQGYGFYLAGVENGTIINCEGESNKHSIEIGGYMNVPVSTNITVENIQCKNDIQASYSTHGAAEGIRWINCKATESGGGFMLRSAGNIIINPEIIILHKITNGAFHIGEFTHDGPWNKFDGNGGKDLLIKNAKVVLGDRNNKSFIYAMDPLENFVIDGGSWVGSKIDYILNVQALYCNNLVIKYATFNVSDTSQENALMNLNLKQNNQPHITLQKNNFIGLQGNRIESNVGYIFNQ